MAWIGDDGLVHTPHGGSYAKTTEAIANFRRQLKYDTSWHRARQRFICLILFIMFATIVTVVVLAWERPVTIVSVTLDDPSRIFWEMDGNCTRSNATMAAGCNVTISPLLSVDINNRNMVPATVSSWEVHHTFYCSAGVVGCTAGGTEFGINSIKLRDREHEIYRKHTDSVRLFDNNSFALRPCKMSNVMNGTYCEWQKSCLNDGRQNADENFLLELYIMAEMSWALTTSTLIEQTVQLGVWCNGTGAVCKVGDKQVKHNDNVCA